MDKRWIVVFVLLSILLGISVVPTRAENPDFYPADEVGPYRVGYSYLQLTDPSRNQDIGGEPIAIDIYYPIDPDNNGEPLLPAEYVADPYNVFGLAKLGYSTIPSTIWEGYGLDPVYQEPTPSQDGPFPLVIFSPGRNTVSYGYIYIGARLASHGFIVAILNDYVDIAGEHLAQALIDRTADVSFTMTNLLALDSEPGELLYGMINENQIAVAGHSLGGYAAMALAGGDAIACDCFTDPLIYDPIEGLPPTETCIPILPDSRIKAIAILDGANQFLSFSELMQINLPAIEIGEEWDVLATDTSWPPLETTTWQARSHLAMQGTPNYRVDVADAEHMSFANWCEVIDVGHDIGYFKNKEYKLLKCPERPISQAEVERLTSMYLIAFLKANLVGESGYQLYLTPGYALNNEPNIEFFVTEPGDPHSVNVNWPDWSYYFDHQPGR